MKQCRKCGTENQDSAKFCKTCGYEFVSQEKKQGEESPKRQRRSENMKSENWNVENFYVVDFFQRVIRTANVPILIYLILNMGIVTVITAGILGVDGPGGILLGIALYLVSIVIALSPVGELILRIQTKCRKIDNEGDAQRLKKLFDEVYEQARGMNPGIPKGVKLYMVKENEANAFATGRKTICVTEGISTLNDEEIKAILGHEFGHLVNHDTDLILMISVGNLIISTIVLAARMIVAMASKIVDIVCILMGDKAAWIPMLCTDCIELAINVVIGVLMWVWTKIGILLVMKSSRENEFEADRFSAELGYREALCCVLRKLDGQGKHMKGLFANLVSSHPKTSQRIERLEKMS